MKILFVILGVITLINIIYIMLKVMEYMEYKSDEETRYKSEIYTLNMKDVPVCKKEDLKKWIMPSISFIGNDGTYFQIFLYRDEEE